MGVVKQRESQRGLVRPVGWVRLWMPGPVRVPDSGPPLAEGRPGERGAALVVALFTLLLLGAALAILAALLASRMDSVQAQVRANTLEALADAALAETLAELDHQPNFPGIPRKAFGPTERGTDDPGAPGFGSDGSPGPGPGGEGEGPPSSGAGWVESEVLRQTGGYRILVRAEALGGSLEVTAWARQTDRGPVVVAWERRGEDRAPDLSPDDDEPDLPGGPDIVLPESPY